jgi:hypothetical protein
MVWDREGRRGKERENGCGWMVMGKVRNTGGLTKEGL